MNASVLHLAAALELTDVRGHNREHRFHSSPLGAGPSVQEVRIDLRQPGVVVDQRLLW
jgi:hypothetical protein